MEDYEKSSMFYGEAEHARIYIQRGIVYMNFKNGQSSVQASRSWHYGSHHLMPTPITETIR